MRFKAITKLDKAFELGILIKAIEGVLEIFGGIVLLAISPSTISHLGTFLTQDELSEDPHDFIANHILHATQHIGHSSLIFGSVYLLAHGIVKVVLVAEILRNRLWAYPGLIIITSGFMAYQTYQFTFSRSVWLVALTLFDAVVVYLTVKEYAKRKQLIS